MTEKKLIKAFIDRFADEEHIRGFTIKMNAAEVREFLLDIECGFTLQKFNKLACCNGRSTNNKYSYSLLHLYNLIKKEKEETTKQIRSYPSNRIYTIAYYGSKRKWQHEYNLLLEEAKRQGCITLVDCCCGSGIVGLVGAESGFDKVVLNDIDGWIVNYHRCIQNEDTFKAFKGYLEQIGDLHEELFYILKNRLPGANKSVKRHAPAVTNDRLF